MSRGAKVSIVGVIVQATVIKAGSSARVCVEGGAFAGVLLPPRVCVCAKTAVRIGAEGLRAGNTSSWLGTSDTLFTRLPL